MKHVYVMEDDEGFTKIGISINPMGRLKHVSSMRGKQVRLIWSSPKVKRAKDIEFSAHTAMIDLRERGEWFLAPADKSIAAVIDAMKRVKVGDLSLSHRLPCVYTRTSPVKNQISLVRFADKEREALLKAAKADDRSISALARKFVVEALKNGGWMK